MSTMTASAHQRLTSFFIGQNPLEVDLLRPTVDLTGTGGTVKGTPTDAGTITGRLVGINRVNSGQSRHTVQGQPVFPQFVFIAMSDENIKMGDYWLTNDGQMYEIIGFAESPPWRINAEVYVHGR